MKLIDTQVHDTSPDDSDKPESYDPSLDMPIALRKGTKSCMKHSMCNYMSYSNLSPNLGCLLQVSTMFCTSLDIPIALRLLWINAIKALLLEIRYERNQRIFQNKASNWMTHLEIARMKNQCSHGVP